MRRTGRIGKNNNGIETIRDAPITDDHRDLLIIAEQLVTWPITYPDLDCFAPYQRLDPDRVQRVQGISSCIVKAITLVHTSENLGPGSIDKPVAASAMLTYLLEAQRQLGALFHLQHDFWACYYGRIRGILNTDLRDGHDAHSVKSWPRNRYELCLLPIDILYHLSASSDRLEYALVCQSMLTAFQSMYFRMTGSQADATHALNTAGRLISRLNMPAYDKWITDLRIQVNNKN